MILCAPTYNLDSSPLEYLKHSFFSHCGITFLVEEDSHDDDPYFSAIIDDKTSIFGLNEVLGKYQLDDHHFFVSFPNKSANILIRDSSSAEKGFVIQYRHCDEISNIAVPSIEEVKTAIDTAKAGEECTECLFWYPEELSNLSISLDETGYHFDESQWIHISDIPDFPKPSCLH